MSPVRVPMTHALERRQPHRGVERLAVLDRRDAGAVAHVAGDEAELVEVLLHQVGAAARDVLVRGAVEAVLADVDTCRTARRASRT